VDHNATPRPVLLKLEAMKILPLLGLVCLLWSGCRSRAPHQARHWQRCTCQYVTDFDGPGRVDVEICSAGDAPAGSAESCAQGLGVGAVSACQCADGTSECRSADVCREAREAPPPRPR
jgi:hypothetical protein